MKGVRHLTSLPAAVRRAVGWLAGDSGAGKSEVHHELMLTLRETPSLMAIAFMWTQIGAVSAAIVTQALWAFLWVGADIVLLAWRIQLRMRRATVADEHRRPTHETLLAAYLLWFASIGLGVFGSLLAGDIRLAILGVMLTIGFCGFAASRFAAAPRLSVVATYLLCGALTAGLMLSSLPGVWMIGVVTPGAAIAFHILMRLNHQILVSALRAEKENRRASLHDPLTGLANRLQLRQVLGSLFEGLERSGRPQSIAVLCVDLDGFKGVNDRYGHASGDWVLKAVAQRLLECVRSHDLVCRIGGDEFVVLLPGADRRAAIEIAQRIVAACAEPHDLGRVAMARLTASIGGAIAPDDGADPDLLLGRADSALYAVKNSGKNRWSMHGDSATHPLSLVAGSDVIANGGLDRRRIG